MEPYNVEGNLVYILNYRINRITNQPSKQQTKAQFKKKKKQITLSSAIVYKYINFMCKSYVSGYDFMYRYYLKLCFMGFPISYEENYSSLIYLNKFITAL